MSPARHARARYAVLGFTLPCPSRLTTAENQAACSAAGNTWIAGCTSSPASAEPMSQVHSAPGAQHAGGFNSQAYERQTGSDGTARVQQTLRRPFLDPKALNLPLFARGARFRKQVPSNAKARRLSVLRTIMKRHTLPQCAIVHLVCTRSLCCSQRSQDEQTKPRRCGDSRPPFHPSRAFRRVGSYGDWRIDRSGAGERVCERDLSVCLPRVLCHPPAGAQRMDETLPGT
jgi:hypothetical protein